MICARYPIMQGPSVPWEVMEPHENMAQKNHGQSLQRLAERGGLSTGEAWCVVSGIILRGGERRETWDEYHKAWIVFAERINLHYAELDTLRTRVKELEDRIAELEGQP